MRIGISLIMMLFLVTSCKYFRGDHCNNTKSIVGTYENTYDKRADNILQIYEDGTFEQTFTKKGVVKKNKGTWVFFEKSCGLKLNNLKLLHDVPGMEGDLFSDKGKYRLNNIVFVEDLGYEYDFYRVD